MRDIKITLKCAVRVRLPKESVADRALVDGALHAQINDAADFWNDGRHNFCVEQFQAAAETIVRNAIGRLVDSLLFNESLRVDPPKGCVELDDNVALAMARVFVRGVDVDDEHTLTVEIEGEP